MEEAEGDLTRTRRWVIALALAGAVLPAWAQKTKRIQLEIRGGQSWTDTGLDVAPGDLVSITASGTLRYPKSPENGPEGLARGWLDLLRALPLNDAGRGALLGRFGDRAGSRPFLIGARSESRATAAGRLFVGINHGGSDLPEGAFQVVIVHTPAGPTQTQPASAAAWPEFTQQMLERVPLRVQDQDGNAGDRVNFFLIGAEEQVKRTLQAAGWVVVDRSVKDSVLRGALATLSKQAYVTLPMSELYLFERPQDYGFAMGDPLRVVASRHHFRIWKAPFTAGGQTVWAGAGTHDIGFDRDQRTGGLTHRIDPDTDKERDFIGQSLQETAAVAKLEYLTPANPLRQARTAHGQEFFTDGRTLIVYLQPDRNDVRARFGDYFCSVLRANPDGGEWGPCQEYLEDPGRDDLSFGEIPNRYRVLIVPGIFSSCLADVPAFLEGMQLFRDQGLTAELLEVPNESSEANAQRIAQHLREQSRKDKRKFILVGYSKGTPDIQVALATEPGLKELVAGFVAVAGASGGSPVADALPGLIDRWADKVNFGNCKGRLSTGMRSLRKEVRQRFLASYPTPVVPTYSLPAVSDESNTSQALMQGWKLMQVFDRFQDSQLTKSDATVPGSKYLGAARADHWAVALPFDKAGDERLRQQVDKARYPRAALFEALVRFVIDDLEGR